MVPAAALAWIAVAVLLTQSWQVAALVGACAALGALLTGRRWVVVAIAGACVAASCGGLAVRVWANDTSPVAALVGSDRSFDLELQLQGDPRGSLQRSQQSWAVAVVVRAVYQQTQWQPVRARATAFISGDVDGLSVGGRIIVRATIRPGSQPGDVARLVVRQWRPSADPAWWWVVGNRLRGAVTAAMTINDDAAAHLVPALVVGNTDALDELTIQDFKTSGLTHLLAVSGTNVTIILAAVLALVRRSRARPLVQVAVALFACGVFVVTARPDPSVLRATVMGVVGVLAIARGAKDASRALSWAVIVLLMIDPWLARSAGFVLSVLATAGIIWLSPMFERRLASWLPRALAVAVAVPIAAQLATMPVIVALSGQISVVSVAANVIVAPAVAPATVLGMLAGIAQLISPVLAWPPAQLARLAALLIVTVAKVSARGEGATIHAVAPSWLVVILTVAAAIVLLKMAARPVAMLALCAAAAFFVMQPGRSALAGGAAIMVACDVGQGDATVLPIDEHSAVLVDTGADSTLVDRCLRRLGIDHLALLVFTHSDADHVAGWRGAIRDRQVDALMVGPSGGPNVPNVPRREAQAGEVLTLGPLQLETIWPGAHPPSTASNDVSIVQRATIHDVRIVLAADVGEAAQRALLREHPDVAADILKVSHHGSADQSEKFIDAVHPVLSTVSCGRHNEYGHPTASTLAMLSREGSSVGRTDLDGTLVVELGPQGLSVHPL
jgi:competence protein ComEC